MLPALTQLLGSKPLVLVGCVVPVLLLTVFIAPSHLKAQEPAKPWPLCWSPEQLMARRGEERIDHGRAAFRAPLKRAPVAYTPLPPAQRLVIRRVNLRPGVKPVIALTFDLCEQAQEVAGYQGSIIDFLRANNIRATFFAGGKWMLSHPDRTKQLASDPLFEIGNHTWEHRNLRRLQGSSLAREIESAQTAYEQIREEMSAKQCLSRDATRATFEVAPSRLSLFRFPFGACNEQALEAVGELGLTAIQWDISSGDPTPGLRPETIARSVIAAARPGSIILFHANGRGWQTPNALPMIVRGLQERGFGFATISDLLTRGEPVYSRVCYDVRPGDTERYDGLADRIEQQYQIARRKALSDPLDPSAVPRPVPAERSFPGKPFQTDVRKTPPE